MYNCQNFLDSGELEELTEDYLTKLNSEKEDKVRKEIKSIISFTTGIKLFSSCVIIVHHCSTMLWSALHPDKVTKNN